MAKLARVILPGYPHHITQRGNRKNWRVYVWQGRFASYPMDRNWLLKAVAYVELNPVRAGMVKQAWDYKWSSLHAHLVSEDKTGIIKNRNILDLVVVTGRTN